MQSRWLLPVHRRVDAPIRLLCLPYSGASAASFVDWRGYVPACVDAQAVQLPGRANRLREPPYSSLPRLVEALTDALLPQLAHPTVLFGHSMGALLAFELARSLRRRDAPAPLALLLSGCRAAHLPSRTRLHDLPQDELLARLAALGGAPAAVLDNRDLLDLLLPALRADLEVAETYRHETESPLDVPIVAFAGDADEQATAADVRAWCVHTTAGCAVEIFAGAHFFLQGAAFRERVAVWLEHIAGDFRECPSV
jgi:surfactin synthase thioesterase subunit